MSKKPIDQLVRSLAWLGMFVTTCLASEASPAKPSASLRVPNNVPPVFAMWGWRESDFTPGGYEQHIDAFAKHSGVNLLATTIRAPAVQVTDDSVHDQIKRAAEYAAKYGIGIAMDLDIRLAREAFYKAYSDELQEMLRLREVALKAAGEVTFSIPSDDLSDHYTFATTHYIPLTGKLVRVYAYERDTNAIKRDTVRDITTSCRVPAANAGAVTVSIPCDARMKGKHACVVVSFTHLAADVFAPHLLSFQRKILERYRDVPLAGACKDEWGFPPCFDGNPTHNDYWYSRFLAKAYAEQTGGRDFVRDCLLMAFGEVGRASDRMAAINQFNELCRQRNAHVENDFYDAVKSVWGRDAVVATHPTWWPYPDRREMKKNGLDWWIVKRDWAQTDEITPYCVRTALAKKLVSPVWFNMYYSPYVKDYQAEMWAGALTGGRIDYHALWPVDLKVMPNQERYYALLRGGLMRGDCRVRLLNFITRSPLDCPVAVVFGQPSAMNWAGQGYDDVGLDLTDALWRAGYPADLIPTTEIWTDALKISEDGYIQYGPQRYRAVVLYNPNLDKSVTAEFFRKAAKGKTSLYRMGNWTHDFDGKSFEGLNSLPGEMAVFSEVKPIVKAISKELKSIGFARQPSADRTIGFSDCRTPAPMARGQSRLVDGTYIIVSGVEDAAGDPIKRTIKVGHRDVDVDAIGLVAIRMDKQGGVEALAVGGLKKIKAGEFEIELTDRVDIALWRDSEGKFHGVLQDCPGEVPEPLRKLTDDWLRLAVPLPLQ